MQMNNKPKYLNEFPMVEESISMYKSEMVRFLQRHYYWDKHDAQTIYHDACLIVLQQLKRGTLQEVNKSYLRKVCKNLGANEYRKGLKEKKLFSAYWTETSRAYLDTIQKSYGMAVFESDECLEIHAKKALRAFSMLDDKCQQIIQLKYVKGHSHKIIADLSEYISTADSAKTTLNRCLKYWRNLNDKIVS